MDKIINVIKFDASIYKRTYTFLMVWVFTFGSYFAFCTKDLSLIPISIMMWAPFTTGLPFVLSERSGVKNLLTTVPINRINIIRGRYIFSLINGLLCLAMSEIMACIWAGLFKMRFDIGVICFYLCCGFLIYYLIISIQLPMYFRFHFKTAILLSPLFLFIAFTISYQSFYSYITNYSYVSIIRLHPILTVAITLVSSVILMFSSYLIACKVYIKKDL